MMHTCVNGTQWVSEEFHLKKKRSKVKQPDQQMYMDLVMY